MSSKEVIEKNKALVDEYPFLLPRNRWTGKVPDNYDYSYTELDAMPEGWRTAFGLQMCKELKEILIKGDVLDSYRIMDIKEKYGVLRWYDNGCPVKAEQEYNSWQEKLIDLSRYTCIICGKQATKMSVGYISPFCDKCANERPHNCYDNIKYRRLKK